MRMPVGVAEVGAPAAADALTATALSDVPVRGIAVVGESAVLDAGQGGVELPLADHERVVVRLGVVHPDAVQADPVGGCDRREVRHRRIDAETG